MNQFHWNGKPLSVQALDDGLWVSPTTEKVSYPSAHSKLISTLEEGSFWFQHRNKCITCIVNRFPPDGTIWDIGGGNGWVALGLEHAGYPAYVVEPSLDGAKTARARGLSPVFCAFLEDLGLPNNSISAACAFDVLEHIENPQNTLESVYAKLKPGGLFYITVPAFQSLWSQEDVLVGHYLRYNVKSLVSLVTSNHFEVLYHTYFFKYLVIPAFISRKIYYFIKQNPYKKGHDKVVMSEHLHESRFIQEVLSFLSRNEHRRLSKGRVDVGTSLLMVCRKPLSEATD